MRSSIGQKLSIISPSACDCRLTGDPRAETTNPVTEECEELILEPTDREYFCKVNYQPDFCTCTSSIHPDNEQ
ncbi:MAG: hypothetical protein EZS28_051017 [Streblomastix strix]|uniref:Uncharacterized protein n=1 Tax=Streblomastix strix TaxID=222440 RepID=A0A5J4T4X7_9EUKA|nr:MAG: hypothetical protein EZS28_051017 [Streblomastix strix]